MNEIDKLEDELKYLQNRRKKKEKEKYLKRKIGQEKFNQSFLGKVANTIGRVSENSKKRKKPTKNTKSVQDLIRDLPQ